MYRREKIRSIKLITVFYISMLVLSLILTTLYFALWHKHFDIHFTLIFAFIPLANLGYPMMSMAENLQDYIIAQKIVYIGGCFLNLFITLAVLSLCRIKIPRIVSVGMFVFSTLVYSSVLSIGYMPLFYNSVELDHVNGSAVVHKEYGLMHTVFIVMTICYFLISFIAMIYSFLRKKNVSRKSIYLMFIPVMVAMISHFLGRNLIDGMEFMPFAYVFAQVMYLLIVERTCLYDITDTTADSLVQNGDKGIVSFDFRMNYLGSNGTARTILPELDTLTVDKPAAYSEELYKDLDVWIKRFGEDENDNKFMYRKGDRTYQIDVNYLYDGKQKRGYQLLITDDTENQKYISLLNSYNSDLKEQVEEKTRSIVEMHDKLILGMATMVESRDNSTGGHIRRTSDVVRMLIDEMKKDDMAGIDDEFCEDIIKAAPMHDLGKIAVDDAILRKPGRFTDDEFAIMKTHAAEGARIVHTILEGTDDIRFHIIAENVAHYHHERWDGSGYPDGLKGTEIPLEARIMAIADVYDALVSKRVYKESMSFEQADRIIMEGMGKHFDKSLEKYYVSARPRLEEYYSSLV